MRRAVEEEEEADYIANDPIPVKQQKNLHQIRVNPSTDARALKHDIKIDEDNLDVQLKVDSKQSKSRQAQRHDIRIDDLEASTELQEVTENKAKTGSKQGQQRRVNQVANRDNDKESNQSSNIRILNEKREQSAIRANKKSRPGRTRKMSRSKHETQRDKLDLYEVYFNKDEAEVSKKNKTNIQKIKFKRRSPSVESF